MEKKTAQFEDFMLDVHPADQEFVRTLHGELLGDGCAVKVEPAKSGYVVSYTFGKPKRVVANYVFRKQGLLMRIYGDHAQKYLDIIEALPDGLINAIDKAASCKRLLDPTKCNARCPMGYVFSAKGKEYVKCRYSSFMFLVSEENNPHIKAFISREIAERSA